MFIYFIFLPLFLGFMEFSSELEYLRRILDHFGAGIVGFGLSLELKMAINGGLKRSISRREREDDDVAPWSFQKSHPLQLSREGI